MNPLRSTIARGSCGWVLALFLAAGPARGRLMAQTPPEPDTSSSATSGASTNAASLPSVILEISGRVEFAPASSRAWSPAKLQQALGPGDQVRTLERSRAAIRLPNQSILRLNERSSVEIQKGAATGAKATLNLKSGAAYFFGRGQPDAISVRTPSASGAIRGTEFHVAVAESGESTFTLLEGAMEIANASGASDLHPGEQARASVGTRPQVSPAIQVERILQWCLHYPSIIEWSELEFAPAEAGELASVLEACRSGDLGAALIALPPPREGASDARAVLEAALWLSAGQIDAAGDRLASVKEPAGSPSPVIEAIRTMVATVQGNPPAASPEDDRATKSPSLLLARSYAAQARFDLESALELAREAARLAPDSGGAWARVAELEFGHGRIRSAAEALGRALTASPRNAQAWVLQGFLLAARNRMAAAREAFEKATRLDPSLGEAWLGLGLSRIRRGDLSGGMADLQTAAAVEPRRAMLRSYLAKAFSLAHDPRHALSEIQIALALDKADPSIWLYSALLSYERHEVNRAIDELERSVVLNDNRRLFRSRFLLDQDKAVEGANLANFYRVAGLQDLSTHEASRAVMTDYSNPAAHRFLADSFNAQRDPTRFNLRNEALWFHETLMADLLSPVGGGSLSQNLSQQEYSKLLERDRLGLDTTSVLRSDGQFQQVASQYGWFGNSSYALDLDYQHNDGVRPNNDLSRIEWYTKFKQQFNERDSLFLMAKYQDYHSGDNFQYYDPAKARPGFRYDEFQSPYVVGAFHREWAPGVHTLALAGTFSVEQDFRDRGVGLPLIERNAAGAITRLRRPIFDLEHGSDFTFQSGEIQQIVQSDENTILIGGRYQTGEFELQDRLRLPAGSPFTPLFGAAALDRTGQAPFERGTGYAYGTHEFWDQLQLTAGASWDDVLVPLNHRSPPVSSSGSRESQLSPKAALAWAPSPVWSVRAMYGQFLGGVSFDESYRLEPAQLAGFGQAYRSLISESIVGSVSGPSYEVAGVGADLKLPSRTYLGVQLERLRTDVSNPVGAFTLPLPVGTTMLLRNLDYEEHVLGAYVQQLLSDEWSVGATYTVRDSALDTRYPQLPVSVAGAASSEEATLHQIRASLLFNHRCGFFSRLDSQWYLQDNRGYSPGLPGDFAHQLDLTAGYRLPRRLGVVSVTVANLTDEDYRLNPLTPYAEMPRERVVMARLSLQF